MKQICKQCGREFELSDGEIQFYKSKNLYIPKRCKECREKNKSNKQVADYIIKSESKSNIHDNTYNQSILRYIIPILIMIIFVAGVFFKSIDFFGGKTSDIGFRSEEQLNEHFQKRGKTSDIGFRSEKQLNEHFQKHGIDMGFSTAEEYEAAAVSVVKNSVSLHKIEKEDGDDVYYLESSNEFVVVSTDGYIRTYFKPNDGIDYYNRQ